jgi:hypothetical protein
MGAVEVAFSGALQTAVHQPMERRRLTSEFPPLTGHFARRCNFSVMPSICLLTMKPNLYYFLIQNDSESQVSGEGG